MNWLQYFFRAQTQYNLHSPFVYRLYTEVLFARASGHGRSAADVLWRLEQYYGLDHSASDVSFPQQLVTCDGLFAVYDHPHRDESAWQDVIHDAAWQVVVDLFSCGIAISNPHLSKQYFILR